MGRDEQIKEIHIKTADVAFLAICRIPQARPGYGGVMTTN